MKFEDFIYIKKKTLTKDFCNHCIEKFEKDHRVTPGKMGKGVDLDIKRSMDLPIDSFPQWKDEVKVFEASLEKHYENYVGKFLPKEYQQFLYGQSIGFQIQKTSPGEFYKWHHDSIDGRIATYIWYLNDVEHDGYTEFNCGIKVKPKAGKIVLFPATWHYIHRGYPPKKETKYICTGWMYPPKQSLLPDPTIISLFDM